MTEGRSLEPGRVVGNYRVIRCLGRGGMGEVFEVEHEPVEPPLTHQLGFEKKLATGAPDIGNRQARSHLAEAKLEHRTADARLAFERTTELGWSRRGLRHEELGPASRACPGAPGHAVARRDGRAAELRNGRAVSLARRREVAC